MGACLTILLKINQLFRFREKVELQIKMELLNDWRVALAFCIGIGLIVSGVIICISGFCFLCFKFRAENRQIEEAQIEKKQNVCQNKEINSTNAWPFENFGKILRTSVEISAPFPRFFSKKRAVCAEMR